MKQKIRKQVSLFFSKIAPIVGTFILTTGFFIKYFVNVGWEIFMMVVSHDDQDEKAKKTTEEGEEEIFKFSYIWKLLENQSTKQVAKTILIHAKDMAHQMNKRFWLDMTMILPFILAILFVLLLFILAAILGVVNFISIWILVMIGIALYFIFLFRLRKIFKKFLKWKLTVFFGRPVFI
jgi:hypothetical protein